MHSLDRLRLAAASAHQVPGASMTLWPEDGPSVVVSRFPENQPDLSPCTLRALVVAVLAGDPVPVGLRWMFDLADITVGGSSVCHIGDGVVRVGGRGTQGAGGDGAGRWWPTLIDPHSIAAVMADAAAEALERGLVGTDVVAAADVSAHADTSLDVTVVHLRTLPGGVEHERRCDALARSMARSCAIAELLHSAGSGSTAGGR